MGLPKGKTNNPNGRPAGSKNIRTQEWEVIKEAFVTVHTERANRILATLEDEKFLDAYLKLLEYFKPKLARSENTNTNDTSVSIVVNWDNDQKFIHTTSKAALQSGESNQGS